MPVLLEEKVVLVVSILADKHEKPPKPVIQPKQSPPGIQCLGNTKRGRCRHSTLATWTSKLHTESILATGRCLFHQ